MGTIKMIDLDQLCAEAMQRSSYFISRRAAQQQRRMRENWERS